VNCQEFVELVTEYLEGTLDPSDSARFAAHIEQCDGCSEYLVQFRETIAAVGHLPPESIDPAAAAKFQDVFRDWKRDGRQRRGWSTVWRRWRRSPERSFRAHATVGFVPGTKTTPSPAHVAFVPGTKTTPSPAHVGFVPGTKTTPSSAPVVFVPGTETTTA
jgi:anti-sigma factor RsiW